MTYAFIDVVLEQQLQPSKQRESRMMQGWNELASFNNSLLGTQDLEKKE
jgi:hypothetical protein